MADHGPLFYLRVQPTEPTDVDVGVVWIDTSTTPHPIYTRNDTNTDWDDAGVVGGAGDLNYTHTQAVANTTWTITHNLGKRPAVTIVDGSENVIYGDIEHVSNNQLVIRFASAQAGKAYLN